MKQTSPCIRLHIRKTPSKASVCDSVCFVYLQHWGMCCQCFYFLLFPLFKFIFFPNSWNFLHGRTLSLKQIVACLIRHHRACGGYIIVQRLPIRMQLIVDSFCLIVLPIKCLKIEEITCCNFPPPEQYMSWYCSLLLIEPCGSVFPQILDFRWSLMIEGCCN